MDSASSVKCVSTNGNNFTYKSDRLSWPYSHDTDCDGNIYIIGYVSNNIHQLTFDGKCIRIIPVSDLTTITEHPWVLRFKDDNNRFMLTFHDTGKILVCEIDWNHLTQSHVSGHYILYLGHSMQNIGFCEVIWHTIV
jgi:hypothetical protein